MHSLRKWFYKPKKEDTSKLAMFYWADEELTMVTTELDSFDGRTDPERCSILVTQLRFCQDKVLSICNEIMDEAIPDLRANRDFRAKFPDDVLHENLAGQLWFGAECLAAGSNIIHREVESASMRPLAKALTRALENVRCLLREQSLKNVQEYSPKVKDALRIFDRLFAEFELCYVSTMVPIKSAKEYHLQQEIVVLFSETLIRGLKLSLIKQEMIDDYDPSLMFTIPRLAIVWGLFIFPDGPFDVDRDAENMSELFRPFRSLLHKIRDLLWTLTTKELSTLEKMLCSLEEPKIEEKENDEIPFPSAEDYVSKFCQNDLNPKRFVQEFFLHCFGMIVDEAGNEIELDEETLNSYLKNGIIKSKHLWRLKNIRSKLLRNGSADHLESDINSLVCSNLSTPNRRGSLPSLSDSAQKDDVRRDQSSALNATNETRVERKCLQRTLNESSERTCNVSLSKLENTCLCSRPDSFSVPVSSDGALLQESHFSQLRSHCSCALGTANSSRQQHRSSRALLQHVMSQVKIMPPEPQPAGYTSSPENRPGVFHSMSHSFPSCNAFTDVHNSSEALYVPTAAPFRCRDQSPSFKRNCGVAQSRSHNCDNHRSPARSLTSSKKNSNLSDSSPLLIPRVKPLDGHATNSVCFSCHSLSSVSSDDQDDQNCAGSPDTSSFDSEGQDYEEIAIALQAAEIEYHHRPRSRFTSSNDLLHKLFVCISGVADQLQTNYASDLRNILKSVFDMNCTQSATQTDPSSPETSSPHEEIVNENTCDVSQSEGHTGDVHSATEPSSFAVDLLTDPVLNFQQLTDDERDRSSVDSAEEAMPDSPGSLVILEENANPMHGYPIGPPAWLPDELSSHCMACELPFTILRRRHHCRNCGKIFCSRCSSNLIPLPQFGHLKPVRVCNQCFMYQITSLVMHSTTST